MATKAKGSKTETDKETPMAGQMGIEMFRDPDSDLTIDNPPDTENPVVIALFPQIQDVCRQIDENQKIVDANNITPENVVKNAKSSSDEEIVAARTTHAQLTDEIADLEARLAEAREKQSEIWQQMLKRSREELEMAQDKDAEVQAKNNLQDLRSRLNSFASTIRFTEPDDDWHSYLSVLLREYAPVWSGNASKARKSREEAERNRILAKKAREWAVDTGWVNPDTGKPVNLQGRVPQKLLDDYLAEFPEEKENLGTVQ